MFKFSGCRELVASRSKALQDISHSLPNGFIEGRVKTLTLCPV
jgi:hypothetical protein